MLGASSAQPWASRSAVQALVDQACDPTLMSPNDVVNIELAELINSKKANSAREATHALLTYINSRNPNQSLLALNVLDHIVKNCGYAVQLQISTKEFLNELVRRFPERPPMVVGRVMGRILELIHEWKNTICVSSKYKDDLVHIRDMHRLLSYKGYRFKAFDAARAMATSNPNENLKSPEELEDEDRTAKQAKLQELIRRATPRDLAAAQELMKQLAGAEPDKAVDYEKQTITEVEKVQSKAILLNDMLDNANEGEKIGLEGDVYSQVAAACRGARPKIQKFIEEDTGEHEGMMDRLLLCNDLINNALDRYEACKKGDWVAARAVVEQSNPTSKANDLINFDVFADDEPAGGGLALPSGSAAEASASNPGFTTGGLPLDLFGPSPSGSPAPAEPYHVPSAASSSRVDPMSFFNSAPTQPSLFAQQNTGSSSPFGQASPAPQASPSYPQAQTSQVFGQPLQSQQAQAQAAQQQQFGGLFAQQQPPQQQQQQQTQAQFGFGGLSAAPTAPAQPAKKDAFADLVDLMG